MSLLINYVHTNLYSCIILIVYEHNNSFTGVIFMITALLRKAKDFSNFMNN